MFLAISLLIIVRFSKFKNSLEAKNFLHLSKCSFGLTDPTLQRTLRICCGRPWTLFIQCYYIGPHWKYLFFYVKGPDIYYQRGWAGQNFRNIRSFFVGPSPLWSKYFCTPPPHNGIICFFANLPNKNKGPFSINLWLEGGGGGGFDPDGLSKTNSPHLKTLSDFTNLNTPRSKTSTPKS